MARRREHRVGPKQNPRSQRSDTPAPEEKPNHSASASASDRNLLAIFVVFFVVIPATSVLVYSIKYASTKNSPSEAPVSERGLIKTQVTYEEILNENSKVRENVSSRYFTNPVLAYITPWNSRGYEMAKLFNSKFTHLSPVWYELKSEGTSLVLEGRHNADKGWMSELRMIGDALVVLNAAPIIYFYGLQSRGDIQQWVKLEVLPRVVIEANPLELLRKKKQMDKAINLIVSECREMEYDGIVLESWSRWASYIVHYPDLRSLALKFIKQLGHALHSAKSSWKDEHHLQLIYVIGPPHSDKLQQYDFGPEDLKSLIDAVDGFSLMTYDFSGPHSPGPNAPLQWIRLILQLLLGPSGSHAPSIARKIFLGINFYGNDFTVSGGTGGGGTIIGRDYLSLLDKNRPQIHWERDSAEHFLVYVDDHGVKHAVFYPSLMSINLRLEEARRWGTGISIWEIGQGLDYFFYLF